MAYMERIDFGTRIAGEKAQKPDEYLTFSQVTAGTGIELTQDPNMDIQINVTGATSNDFLKRSANDYTTFDAGTLATLDVFLVEDADDSYSKKKVSVQDVIDLVPSGGSLPSGIENQTLRYNSDDELEATNNVTISIGSGGDTENVNMLVQSGEELSGVSMGTSRETDIQSESNIGVASYSGDWNDSASISINARNDDYNDKRISQILISRYDDSDAIPSNYLELKVDSEDDAILRYISDAPKVILTETGELTLDDLSGTGDAYIGADEDGKLKRMATLEAGEELPSGTEHQTLRYDATNGWEATSVLKVDDVNRSICAGSSNVASAYCSVVSGGRGNRANTSYSNVGGGYNNRASGSYACIPGGTGLIVGKNSFGFRGVNTYNASKLNISADISTANFVDVMPRNIVARESIINSLYSEPIWSGETANDTPIEIFLYNRSTNPRFVLTNNSSITYELRIVARDSSGDVSEWVADGLITRDTTAASTTLLRYAIVAKYEDDSAWDCNITADTTNGSLKVTVTGDDTNTTKWTVAGRLTEVRY